MAKANKLFTKTAYKEVPAIRSTDGQGDSAVVHVRLFSPLSGWAWYVTEFDPETGEAFGLIHGHETELGTFAIGLGDDQYSGESMQDLNNNFRAKGLRMPPYERDLHWTPRFIGDIKGRITRGSL